MNLIRLATRRPVSIAMLTVAVVLFGLVSLSRLDLSLLPDLSYPSLTVRTDFAGAAPAEIESLITRPVEEAVGVVRGVRGVRSASRPGQSDVSLSFAWGTNMDHAALDVRERLDMLELPRQVGRPLLLRFDPSSEPILRLALARRGDVAPDADGLALPPAGSGDQSDSLRALRRHADEEIRRALEAGAGVAAITVSGGLEDEIQVLLDPRRLAQLGLSAEEVARRLQLENVNLSGGRLQEGSRQYLVRTVNAFETIEQIGDTILSVRDGRPLLLRDVAEVREGWREREAMTRFNGEEMVELAIYREGDANVVAVARELHRRLAALDSTLPPDLSLSVTYDQSVFIRNAIAQVVQAALLGGLLAIAVLFLFLRNLRATVIIGLAIPISVIATFAAMHAGGITLNIMSLGGIALAIGLLVDNAIVVLENIAAKREQGLSALAAAREGASEVAGAIIAATLTSIAVFLPLVFVEGLAGQLFRDQALTVTFALLVSLAVALSLIPMLASLGTERRRGVATEPAHRQPGKLAALRRGMAQAITWLVVKTLGLLRLVLRAAAWAISLVLTPLLRAFNAVYEPLAAGYAPLLERALTHRAITVSLALGLFVLALALLPRLGMELVPSLAQGEFQVELRLAPGTPLDVTDQRLAELDRVARALPEVLRTDAVAGVGRRLDANPEEAGEHTGSLNVVLKPGASEDRVLAQLRDHLAGMPGIEYRIERPSLFELATPLEIEIVGHDLNTLARVAEQVLARLSASGQFADLNSSTARGHPEIMIRFDHERAARLGLRADQIADTVVRQMRGDVATRYLAGDRRIDVLVRASDEQRRSLDALGQMIVNPGAERPVSLAAVAELTVATGPSEIQRRGQQRVAVISAVPATGDLGQAADTARTLLASMPLPDGISLRVAGQSEDMQQAFRALLFALALAVFLVYLVMASQFESLLHPFVILFSIPLALTGAVLALWLTGLSLSVIVFIGLIMLAGIVVNNAIVLVTRINQLRAQGLPRDTAIVAAGKARLRPIVMTTLTTTLGLLPLALGMGEGAEMRQPMAVTVIGGLLLATLLTLVVIPVIYSLFDRRGEPVGHDNRAEVQPA